jgi:hypothetical protein
MPYADTHPMDIQIWGFHGNDTANAGAILDVGARFIAPASAAADDRITVGHRAQ